MRVFLYIHVHGTDEENSGSLISCPRGSRRGYIISPVRRKRREGERGRARRRPSISRSSSFLGEMLRFDRFLEIVLTPAKNQIQNDAALTMRCESMTRLLLISNDTCQVERKRERGNGAISGVETASDCADVKVNCKTHAGELISIVGGPHVIYHDSLRAGRREGEYTRIDMELATVARVRLRRDRRSDLSVKTTRVRRSEN